MLNLDIFDNKYMFQVLKITLTIQFWTFPRAMMKASSRITTKMKPEQSHAPSHNFNHPLHLNLRVHIFKNITKVTFFIQVFSPDLYYTTAVQDHQELMTDCMNTSVLRGMTQLQHIARGIKINKKAVSWVTQSYMRNSKDNKSIPQN